VSGRQPRYRPSLGREGVNDLRDLPGHYFRKATFHKEDQMKRHDGTTVRKVMQRVAALTCVAVLGFGAAACGSSSTTNHSNQPPATTSPSGATTAPATPAATTPATTSPQSGGAGF
jgi:hypothetical protein